MGAWRSVSAAGVRMLAVRPGSRCRARMLRTTSAEWTPWASAVAQGAGLAGEHRDVVPRVVERSPTAERTGMFGDDPPVLADYDAVGIGMNLDRTPDCVGCHRVFVVVEANQ